MKERTYIVNNAQVGQAVSIEKVHTFTTLSQNKVALISNRHLVVYLSY